MQIHVRYLPGPGGQPPGPAARLLAALAAVLLLVSSFFLGLLMFMVLLGAGLIFGIWAAWRARKARRQAGGGAGPDGVIDGDYVVVSRRDSEKSKQ